MKFSPEKIATIFSEHLLQESKLEDLRRISGFWNSFEGWAKWELALALSREPRRYPWTSGKEEAKPNQIGVEYLAKIDGRRSVSRGSGKVRKLIDLWVEDDASKWHAIELKVVFKNQNKGKQFESFVSDYSFMSSITGDKPESTLALALAVGFFDSELEPQEGFFLQLLQARNDGEDGVVGVVGVDWSPNVHIVALGCKTKPTSAWKPNNANADGRSAKGR